MEKEKIEYVLKYMEQSPIDQKITNLHGDYRCGGHGDRGSWHLLEEKPFEDIED